MDVLGQLNQSIGLASRLVRTGVLAPLRPDKYVRVVDAFQRESSVLTAGFAAARQRCPDRAGLIDERGILTWRQIDRRADAFAAALQQSPGGAPELIALLARNHRYVVDTLLAAHRVGSEVLLLSPDLDAATVRRLLDTEGEGKTTVVVHDDEFTGVLDAALAGLPPMERIAAWTDATGAQRSVDGMIEACDGRTPRRTLHTTRVVLLTCDSPPRGVAHTGGRLRTVVDLLGRIPWRAEEPVVVATPMWSAWGYQQLMLAAFTAATVVTSRVSAAQDALDLVDKYRATGLCVDAALLGAIAALPEEIVGQRGRRSLRFVTAAGAGIGSEVLTAVRDIVGDIVHTCYHTPEFGTLTTASPRDLRAAPGTAGRPTDGTALRILDGDLHATGPGEVGRIYVRAPASSTGYTSGRRRDAHDGYLPTGDIGFLDADGRLFVVGRDDGNRGPDA